MCSILLEPNELAKAYFQVEKWNHNGDIKCGFCKKCSDSSPHLFFQCDFSMKIWRKMIKLSYLMDMQFNLQDVIESMAGRRGMKSIGNMVNKLILAATVYFIWQERNFRLFKEECRSEDVLFNIIYECVKSKLMTIRVKKTVRTDLIAKKWNLVWRNQSLIAA
ncbi:hypothetical protein Tco_1181885 [Tanacetum coccineum]